MSTRYYDIYGNIYFEQTKHIDMTDLYKPFLATIPKGAYILDAGCGSGRDSRYFIQNGYRVMAIDGSEKMVSLASSHIGQTVTLMLFEEIDFQNTFDGIWACASLLHVPRRELSNIFQLLLLALKVNGTLYASFKWGDSVRTVEERQFIDFNQDSFSKFIAPFKQLEVLKLWKNSDKIRQDTFWLNVLLKHRA